MFSQVTRTTELCTHFCTHFRFKSFDFCGFARRRRLQNCERLGPSSVSSFAEGRCSSYGYGLDEDRNELKGKNFVKRSDGVGCVNSSAVRIWLVLQPDRIYAPHTPGVGFSSTRISLRRATLGDDGLKGPGGDADLVRGFGRSVTRGLVTAPGRSRPLGPLALFVADSESSGAAGLRPGGVLMLLPPKRFA